MKALIVKCKCSVSRVDVDVDAERGFLLQTDTNAWVRAAQEQSYVTERLTGGWVRTAWFGCLTCRRPFKVEAIKGRKTNHECDARCMASQGPTCECACGGRNHGASYA